MIKKLFQYDAVKATGIYLLLLIVLFSSVFIKGYIFGGGDSTAAKGMTQQLNIYLNETGDYPLWQPYIFSGMPAFSSHMYTQFVYFPGIILRFLRMIFGMPVLWGMLFHYVLAALGAYTFLRHLKVDFLSSVLGGLIYMLTPFFIVMISAGHGSQMMTAAYLPWLLYAVKRIFDEPDLKGLLILAVVAGFQFQRGHVQVAYYGWMAAGWYAVIDAIFRYREKSWDGFGKALAYLSGGLILGLGMAIVLYLPSLTYAAYSIRGGGAGGGLDYGYATGWSFPPAEIISFFVSDWFGFGGQNYWGARQFTEHSDYFGMAVIILVLSAFLNKEYLKEKIFLGSAVIIALLVSFGAHWDWVYKLLFNYLPFFNKFRVPSMILILVEVLVAILAGLGLYALVRTRDEEKTKWTKPALTTLGVLGIILVLILLMKSSIENGFAGMLAESPKAHPSLVSIRTSMFYTSLVKSLAIALASIALIWAFFANRIPAVLLSTGFVLLVVIDLGQIDRRFTENAVPVHRLKNYEQESPAIKKMKELTAGNHCRIFPVHQLFASNIWAMYGLESIGGYSPAKLKLYQDFLSRSQLEQGFLMKYYKQSSGGTVARELNEIDPVLMKLHHNALQVLNVGYLISPYPIPDTSFIPIAQSEHNHRGQRNQVMIYKFREQLPRAWFIEQLYTVNNNDAGFAAMLDPAFDPGKQAVVWSGNDTLREGTYTTGQVEIIEQTLQSLILETQTGEEGFLVLSEIYYPNGWKAVMDNTTELKIWRTDDLIRGIVVPPGEHIIQFTFLPASVTLGFWLTVLSTVILAALITFIVVKKAG